MKKEIETLILIGYLKEFATDIWQARKTMKEDKSKHDSSSKHEAPQTSKKGFYVRMIAGGPIVYGESKRVKVGHLCPQPLSERNSISLVTTNFSHPNPNYVHEERWKSYLILSWFDIYYITEDYSQATLLMLGQ